MFLLYYVHPRPPFLLCLALHRFYLHYNIWVLPGRNPLPSYPITAIMAGLFILSFSLPSLR